MSTAQIRQAIEKTSKLISAEPAKARVKNPAATATTPSWLMRSALASCSATCIAMRAAQRGINLTRLEVTVSSESDQRGLLGVDEAVPTGLQSLHMHVRISAPGTSPQELNDLVRSAHSRSPVGCTDPSTARLDIQIEEA